MNDYIESYEFQITRMPHFTKHELFLSVSFRALTDINFALELDDYETAKSLSEQYQEFKNFVFYNLDI